MVGNNNPVGKMTQPELDRATVRRLKSGLKVASMPEHSAEPLTAVWFRRRLLFAVRFARAFSYAILVSPLTFARLFKMFRRSTRKRGQS